MSEQRLYCSFCGKSDKELKALIAGPTALICDECVEICVNVLKQDHDLQLLAIITHGWQPK